MRKTVKVLAWVAAVLAVIITALRLTIMSWWTVPTDDPVLAASLAPNLAAGDFILLYNAAPSYGDLVRCSDPEAPGRFIVGRVLAEAGDTIELTSTNVTVNGKTSVVDMPCGITKVPVEHPQSGATEDLFCQFEALQGHKHMRVTRNASTVTNEGKRQVSEGNIFLVSDNRAFPMDSRTYGAIPRASCKEQVFFRVFGKKGLGDPVTRFVYIR